ncbi:MAG TPA: VOC family protein, partial [Alphaproteobacteria bacterium]
KKFYDAALATLGFKCVREEFDNSIDRLGAAGYGLQKPFFWVCLPHDLNKPAQPCNGSHVAFRANSKEQVQEFYKAAIANGGTTETPPGPCPEYHENYYAAYIYDPDGHKVEVVFGNTQGDRNSYDPS